MNLKTKNQSSLDSRLAGYLNESVINKVRDKKWGSRGLLMLAPFAATMMESNSLSGQVCSTPINNANLPYILNLFSTYGPMGNSSTAPVFGFDVDGDGNNELFIYARQGGIYTASSRYFAIGTLGAIPPTAPPLNIQGYAIGPYIVQFYPSKLNSGSAINPQTSININYGKIAVRRTFRMPTGTGTGTGYTTSYRYYGPFNTQYGPGTGFIGMSLNGSEGWISLSISNGGTQLEVDAFAFEQDVATGDAIAGDCFSILPVEYLNFKSKALKGAISIKWETASEINNQGWEVERSINGHNFEKIGWVNGSGNSSTNVNYGFFDRDIQPNVGYYYRLKQVDYNGKVEYSEVISEMWVDGNAFTVSEVWPNPTNQNYINVGIDSGNEEGIELLIFDQSGELIKKEKQHMDPGPNNLTIELGDIPAGSYFIKMITETQVYYKKFAIVN